MKDAFAEKLKDIKPNPKKTFLIGFDGFTDEIIDVVSRRNNKTSYEAFPTIKAFGERILDSQNKSANIELVSRETKLGGNAPILCNALIKQGHHGVFIGPIGEEGAIEPLFQEMADNCSEVITLGSSAHTDALEFADGKLMLGKHQAIRDVNYLNVLTKAGEEKLIKFFSECYLFGNTTWTLLLGMNNLWGGIIKNILPKVPKKSKENNRFMFVDLCDPSKRSIDELLEAMKLLQDFKPWFDVILGLNIVEIQKVASCLGLEIEFTKAEDYEKGLEYIAKHTQFSQVALHTKEFCMVYHEGNLSRLNVELCLKPKISTGAGDNFNAGFCGGLLLGLTPADCLHLGIITSGFYVRNGHSATLDNIRDNIHSFQ